MWGALQNCGVTGGGEGVVDGVTLKSAERKRVKWRSWAPQVSWSRHSDPVDSWRSPQPSQAVPGTLVRQLDSPLDGRVARHFIAVDSILGGLKVHKGCPFCSVDAVIGPASGHSSTDEFISQMKWR